MQGAVNKVFMWCYEVFSEEAVTNTQNDRLYARDAGCSPEGSRTHLSRMKQAGAMVWAAVASDGPKSPLVYIQNRVEVNTQVYIKMQTKKVLPW